MSNKSTSNISRFRPAAGVLQSWDADKGWQAERGWKCPVIIDNMMNLELLFEASIETFPAEFYSERYTVQSADIYTVLRSFLHLSVHRPFPYRDRCV